MPDALANQVVSSALPLPASGRKRFRIHVWPAPLVPVALALTAGIVLDRRYGVAAGVRFAGGTRVLFHRGGLDLSSRGHNWR
jgi:hypothetical protein